MTNNELLLAMSKLLEPIRMDIKEIKTDVAELKVRVSKLEADVAELKADVAELKDRVKKIELSMETNVLPRLQTIEACYTSTFERYKNSVGDYENMKQDISVIKCVVMEHSSKIIKYHK